MSTTTDSTIQSKSPTHSDPGFRRDIIISILQSRFAELTNTNLKIFHIYNEKNLKGFTTTEVDKKRGTSRFPLLHYRFTDTDLLKEDYGKSQNPLGDD